MSFLGGAECSTAGNPLSQFTKHVGDDKSLQHDRLVGRGPNSAMGGFRNVGRNTPQDEMVNGFLHQNATLPDMPLEQQQGPLAHAHLDHLRAQSGSPLSPTWAPDTQAAMEAAFNAPPGTHFSADEFAKFQHMNPAAAVSHAPSMPGASASMQRPMMMGGGMSYNMMQRPMYQPMFGGQMHMAHQPLQQHQQPAVEGKGKGKVVELDESKWEEQFQQMELHDRQLRETEKDEALAMEPELNKMDEKLLHSETGYGDLESIWRGIQAEQAQLKELDDIEDDFAKFDSANFGGDNLHDWGLNNRLGADPIVQDYLFEDENIFENTTNPFEEGIRIMNEGGNLSLAALAFEAAVQKDPEHVEAWVYLGHVQAQNEKEEAAIRALEQAMKLDPNNLAALMGLAVSYTNEGYDSTAYRTLERWLSVKYPQVIAPQDLSSAAELGFTDRAQLHDRVTSLFLEAARLAPDGDHMDPDVQVGLGVLFYGAEEYDKAVDCFQAALHSSEMGTSNQREQIHLLWNRLGATLANSGRSEEAIAAYEKALSINPNFVRARYNLGVSCINIGCHAEAAGHLLASLDMHKSVEKSGREKARELLGGGGGPDTDARIDAMTTQNRSTTLYDTLRRVFTQMGRRDLAEKVVVGVDPDIFRGEFDF
ncbi:Peroxisomal membrane signal receptor PTS1 [Podospora pseudopauciseta]|uniref:Peroxisomal membrane signal receptor PTS1 n=2 Tax=Podospora TaxID=5144 RepID=A0ABR0I276_9PEZI|nr:Peroxisomal membrane signal receptor PTS1 [Podospora pseudopauciseta]KAK4682708.1 Peroxisomal membrane signal receptor PTS1 [Podospora pseudoanserina]